MKTRAFLVLLVLVMALAGFTRFAKPVSGGADPFQIDGADATWSATFAQTPQQLRDHVNAIGDRYVVNFANTLAYIGLHVIPVPVQTLLKQVPVRFLIYCAIPVWIWSSSLCRRR